MGLEDKLREDLKDSLRKGEKLRTSTLRLTISAIKYAEMDKGGELDDASIHVVLSKEVRKRQESIEAFEKGNRPDLASKEREEMQILQAYLPRQMSRDEITAAARAIIAETGARGPQDKGKVMSKLVAELKGKADGREINAVVTDLLAGK